MWFREMVASKHIKYLITDNMTQDLKESPIMIKIPSFFIPKDIARKYRSIVKSENLVNKLKNR